MGVSLQRTALAITRLTVRAGDLRRKWKNRTDSVQSSNWRRPAGSGRMSHAEVLAVLSDRAGGGDPGGSMDAAHRARARARKPSFQRDRARAARNLAIAAGITSPGPGRRGRR